MKPFWSAQEFVDKLNAAEMPRMGYVLEEVKTEAGTLRHWVWPSKVGQGERYPADAFTRKQETA